MFCQLYPKNESLFVFDLKSVGYKEKEKGQINFSTDLSSVAPQSIEMLNLWNDFRKVVNAILLATIALRNP